jgi:peptide/nickel transport system permease protein
MLSRVIHGGRASLLIGVLPVLASLVIGGAYGLVAGAYGGWLRAALMRFMDVFFAFPAVLLAIAIGVVLGPGLLTPIVALTVVLVPALARVAEGATLVVSSSEYVEAARASGAPRWRVTLVHILPNALPAVVAYCFSMFGPVLVFGAGLSFLGLGTQPPTPEWGSMLSGLQASLWLAPITSMVPGIPIMLTALAFDVVGNAVRDLLDPRLGS